MAGARVFLRHPSSLEHDTGPHPERAARITAIERELAGRDWLGYERLESEPVERAVLEAVHSGRYVDWIEQQSSAGSYLDPDTIVGPGSFKAALHGSGGAVQLVDLLLDGAVTTGFSAHRPPGHHAETSRAMGFCLFNHVAIAARYALERRGLERVLIFDWDVHHGNGTNDIFYSSREVLYISIHQSPLYPGTGSADDAGSGEGKGFTINLPVAPGAGDELFCGLVDHVVVPLALSYQPQLVLLSAGFDAHREDPLASCLVTEAGFDAMARAVVAMARELEVSVGAVLEGGYALEPLARSVATTLAALAASPQSPAPDPPPPVLLVTKARERLARWWPDLAV